jgi:radical SAM protein with 4Fe4S-binding SPASM domain
MPLNENEIYLFNPAYVMRNDSHRIVLFAGNKTNQWSDSNWESFLHPIHAQIFSFFTCNRKLKDTVSLLGKYLNRDEQAIRNIVFPFIENPQPVYTKYKEMKVWIPKNVIINRKKIEGKAAFLNLNPDTFDCHGIDLTSQRNYTGPQFLTFMLNNNCVSNCIYCYADRKTKIDKRLSTARVIELIDEASKLPVRFINLMGGEVFLHPDWHVLLKKLVACNLSPEYISTKYPLTKEIIRSIQKTGFENPVQVSLDACSSDLLMNTLSVPDDYLIKVMKGIILLNKSGLKYRINTVLTTFNTKKEVIKKLFIFITLLKNITDWRITPAVNSNWIDYELFQKIKPDKKELEALYEYIENKLLTVSTIPVLLNKPVINREFQYCNTGSADFKGLKCPALNNQMFILPDGQVTICEQLYWSPRFIIGDVSKNSISEVWNSPAAQKLLNLERTDIQEQSPCKSCKLFEPCFHAMNRCWVDIAKGYGKENWDYPDPRCAFAPPMINDLRF